MSEKRENINQQQSDRINEIVVLFARVDERLISLSQKLDEAIIENKNVFVTKAEFAPVRNIVFGLVSVILLTVFGSLLTLIIKNYN